MFRWRSRRGGNFLDDRSGEPEHRRGDVISEDYSASGASDADSPSMSNVGVDEAAAKGYVGEKFRDDSSVWIHSALNGLERKLVAAAQTKEDGAFERVCLEFHEYFGDIETGQFLASAVYQSDAKRQKALERYASHIFNIASKECCSEKTSKKARVALLKVQAYAVKCILACAIVRVGKASRRNALDDEHAPSKRRSIREKQKGRDAALKFIQSVAAMMQTASRFGEEDELDFGAICVELAIGAAQKLAHPPNGGIALSELTLQAFGDDASYAEETEAKTTAAILHGFCFYLSATFKGLTDAGGVKYSGHEKIMFFARHVLLERPESVSIKDDMKAALAHYFWQFGVALYNIGQYDQAGDYLHVLLDSKSRFMAPISALEGAGSNEATAFNVMALLADVSVQTRDAAKAISILDNLESLVQQRGCTLPPTCRLKLMYTKMRCHIVNSGAGIGIQVASEKEMAAAFGIFNSMVEVLKARPFVIDPKAVTFKILLSACRELCVSTTSYTVDVFNATFEKLKRACQESAASAEDTSALQAAVHETNVLLLSTACSAAEPTWDDLPTKTLESYLWRILEDVHAFVKSHPLDAPRREYLTSELWRLAKSLKASSSSASKAIDVIRIILLCTQDKEIAAFLQLSIAETCLFCFDQNPSAHETKFLQCAVSALRKAWPGLPEFPSKSPFSIKGSALPSKNVLRSLWFHFQVLIRRSGINDDINVEDLCEYLKCIIASGKLSGHINVDDLQHLAAHVHLHDPSPSGSHHAKVLAVLIEAILGFEAESKTLSKDEFACQTQTLCYLRLLIYGFGSDDILQMEFQAHLQSHCNLENLCLLTRGLKEDAVRLGEYFRNDLDEDASESLSQCVAWMLQCAQKFCADALNATVTFGLLVNSSRHSFILNLAHYCLEAASFPGAATSANQNELATCASIAVSALSHYAYVVLVTSKSEEGTMGYLTGIDGDPAVTVTELCDAAVVAVSARKSFGNSPIVPNKRDMMLIDAKLAFVRSAFDPPSVETLKEHIMAAFECSDPFKDWNVALLSQLAYLGTRSDLFQSSARSVCDAVHPLLSAYGKQIGHLAGKKCLPDDSNAMAGYPCILAFLLEHSAASGAAAALEWCEIVRTIAESYSYPLDHAICAARTSWNRGVEVIASQENTPVGDLPFTCCSTATRIMEAALKMPQNKTSANFEFATRMLLTMNEKLGSIKDAGQHGTTPPLPTSAMIGDFLSASKILDRSTKSKNNMEDVM